MELTPGLRRAPPVDTEDVGEDGGLVARIRAEIERDGPITFARFMALALYDPEGGYYRHASARPGRGGDFLTAPEAHPIFGWALARAVADVWRRLGEPTSFVLREFGAGTGTLGLAILAGLAREAPDLFDHIRYQPVEVEPRRIAAIAERFEAAGESGRLTPDAEIGSTIDGLILGNEVLDALPVHRVMGRPGGIRERLVAWSDGRFVEIDGEPSTPALAERLATEGIALQDGQRAEICLEVGPWIADAAAGLGRGALVLIDYGHPASELYDPVRRRAGTLRAYVRHTVHDDPYIHIGRQDLTAHVDVTAVETAAVAAGLTHLGTTTQAEFLAGLGTGDLLAAMATAPDTQLEDYLTARSALVRMLDPAAMGRFRVMGFGRDWPAGAVPSGFAFRLQPPARPSSGTAPD